MRDVGDNVLYHSLSQPEDERENSAIAIEFWAPVVELVGWSVTGGFQTGAGGPTSASGTNIVNVKIGARMGFGGHSSLYVGYGGPVTSADWYNDIVRIEYRYSF